MAVARHLDVNTSQHERRTVLIEAALGLRAGVAATEPGHRNGARLVPPDDSGMDGATKGFSHRPWVVLFVYDPFLQHPNNRLLWQSLCLQSFHPPPSFPHPPKKVSETVGAAAFLSGSRFPSTEFADHDRRSFHTLQADIPQNGHERSRPAGHRHAGRQHHAELQICLISTSAVYGTNRASITI